MLEKPKLFLSAKEFWLVVTILVAFIAIRFLFLYQEYQGFVQKPFYYTEVDVLQQYSKTKNNHTYTVLRLYSNSLGLSFFTRTYRQDNLLDKRVRLKLFPSKQIGFIDYLSAFYIRSEINAVSNKAETFKSVVLNHIAKQHDYPMIAQFYQAIFLANPLPKELRESISKLGISHLIALSGFHLAILSTALFFLFKPLYRYFQQRYFPYRFDLIDLGFIVLVVLGVYVWFVNAPDSLLRSYMMMVVGWLVLIAGVELISFGFLAVVVILLLALVPKMLFSLAFWFSVLGVFYIFLLLHYFKGLKSYWMSLVISIGVFVLMLPIVHIFFPVTSMAQLYSPILSLGFTLFYPLSTVLHLIGFGGLFDTQLIALFTLEGKMIDTYIPMFYGLAYIAISLLAIYSRWFFYLLLIIAVVVMGWMFIPFML